MNEVSAMFDRIAHRYDLLNRLLSMGQDVIWRKRMARYFPKTEKPHVLDLATGTADQLIFLHARNAEIASGVGIDMAEEMLKIGRQKLLDRKLHEIFSLQTGDATNIPFDQDSFDAVTISFGIRNVGNVEKSLEEMYRVLKPGGRALLLEFSLPGNSLLRKFYLLYFRHVLPRIGALISGDGHAYSYLNSTVESFPYGKEFCDLLSSAGFKNIHAYPLTFGIATIYQADKPETVVE